MSSLFNSTLNTRILPTGDMKYIRSDFPEILSDKEIQWLYDNNITMLVDLRSDEEVAKKPCLLQNKEGFNYIHLPVTGGDKVPGTREQLYRSYRRMADARMEIIVDTIMKAESGVMYFCTAGKDRTGVVSAVILKRLGFSDEEIISDYMESNNNLENMLREYVKANPDTDINIVMPQRENIRQLLRSL